MSEDNKTQDNQEEVTEVAKETTEETPTTQESEAPSDAPATEEVVEEAKETEEKPEEEKKEEAKEENSSDLDEPTDTEKSDDTETEEDDDDDDTDITGEELSDLSKNTFETRTRGKQAKNTGRNWYVIHTYSGYEDAVEKALRQRIETFNMQDLIFDIVVPKESSISIKKGSHVTEKHRMFPGYVLIEMIVTDDSWYVVRNTPNVTGFVGSGTIPVPVLPEEFDRIQKHSEQDEPKFKINFAVGENVEIMDGPFKDCEGLIDGLDEKKGRIKVLVNVFGRETPVELEFGQVKKKS